MVGTIIENRFEIGEKLGAGGMGAVYEGRQLDLGRKVAIKIIPRSTTDTPESRRFQNESKLLCRIDHPNVVKVFAAGDTPGFNFIVMDYAPGKPLSSLIESGKFTVEQTLIVAKQMVAALEAMHEHKIVHRDVKPQNIMVSGEGENVRAILVDFGIAKATEMDEQKLTKTGTVLGTPLYMSPEQCASAALDERSDIYSLGCVLFEMLEGEPPFIGETAFAVFHAHMNESAPRLNLPSTPWFAAIIKKMLSKVPDERYQSMKELNDALQSQVAPDLQRETPSQPKRNELPFMSAAAAVLLLCALVYFFQTQPTPTNMPVAQPSPRAIPGKTPEDVQALKDAKTFPELKAAIRGLCDSADSPGRICKEATGKLNMFVAENGAEVADLEWHISEKEKDPERKLHWAIASLFASANYDKGADPDLQRHHLDATNKLADSHRIKATERARAVVQLGPLNKLIASKIPLPDSIPYFEKAISLCDEVHDKVQVTTVFAMYANAFEAGNECVKAAETRVRNMKYVSENKLSGEPLHDAFAQLIRGANILYLNGDFKRVLQVSELYTIEAKKQLARPGIRQTNPDLVSDPVSLKVARALSYFKMGDLKKAKSQLQMDRPPEELRPVHNNWDKRGWLLLAYLNGNEGHLEEMERPLQMAAALNSADDASADSAELYAKISALYRKANLLPQAKSCAELALRDSKIIQIRNPGRIKRMRKLFEEI